MTHKDAPPETPTQTACREWWTKRQPHVTRAWGRDKHGAFLAEEARLLHEAWCASLHTPYEKVECGGAAPPVYVEPKAPKAPAWIDGGEGYWNESNDVYTSPIGIGEWGARIECHGLSQKDAEDLRAEVLRLAAAPADLNQAIVEAREHLLALVKSRALAAEGEQPGEWFGPYIKSEM